MTSDKQRRADEVVQEVAPTNPDPTTRREAVEQALEAEGLSEEGERIASTDPDEVEDEDDEREPIPLPPVSPSSG